MFDQSTELSGFYEYKCDTLRECSVKMIISLSKHFLNFILGTRICSINNVNFDFCQKQCEKSGYKMVDARTGFHWLQKKCFRRNKKVATWRSSDLVYLDFKVLPSEEPLIAKDVADKPKLENLRKFTTIFPSKVGDGYWVSSQNFIIDLIL